MGKLAEDDLGRKLCVLLVEDEMFIAMELADTLTSAGFNVLGPAGSVAEALAILEEEQPHTAVLDVNLEGVPRGPSSEVAWRSVCLGDGKQCGRAIQGPGTRRRGQPREAD